MSAVSIADLQPYDRVPDEPWGLMTVQSVALRAKGKAWAVTFKGAAPIHAKASTLIPTCEDMRRPEGELRIYLEHASGRVWWWRALHPWSDEPLAYRGAVVVPPQSRKVDHRRRKLGRGKGEPSRHYDESADMSRREILRRDAARLALVEVARHVPQYLAVVDVTSGDRIGPHVIGDWRSGKRMALVEGEAVVVEVEDTSPIHPGPGKPLTAVPKRDAR